MPKPFLDAAFAVLAVFLALAPLSGKAEATLPRPVTRMLLLGEAQPPAGMPGGVSVLTMAGLPDAASAKAEFLSAVLRSNAVSSFVAGPDDLGGNTGQLFLRVTAAVAQGGDDGIAIVIGDETLPLAEFGTRLAAMAGAVAPAQRQVAFFHLKDPGGLFSARVSAFQQAVAGAGFALTVAEIGERAGECALGIAPDVALVAGLADRIPFGDGDRRTDVAEAEAWLTAAMARPGRRGPTCNHTYALVVRALPDPQTVVAETTGAVLSPELESQLYRETFEARFLLQSGDPVRVGDFLQACVYCPSEPELTAKLEVLRQEALTRTLEASIWEEIREDTTPERLEIYLANCALCEHRGEAERLLATINARIAAREAEATAFARAAAARDLAALKDYVAQCVACDEKARAETVIAAIEADAAYRAEAAALDAALAARDRAALAAWLESCVTCDRRDEAEAAREGLRQAELLIGPCVAAAGLPQQGGPRQLSDIEPAAARAACDAALAELPQNLLVQVLAARIDQAEGNAALAAPVYDAGVAGGLPQAHGLAAFLRFSPADGSAPDVDTAAKLAQAGAELDDWLSKEILILLYSRELVEGHDAAEAVAIARDMADQGNVVAKFFLGYFLQSGIGTAIDDAGAFDWLAQAVDEGYVRAQPFLAQMYEQGRAVERDDEKAAGLLWSALEKGDSVALTRLTDQMGERPPGVIRIVQQNLRDLDLYRGRADGLAGPGTVRAVRDYAESLKQG